jgi:hypothetical protein
MNPRRLLIIGLLAFLLLSCNLSNVARPTDAPPTAVLPTLPPTTVPPTLPPTVVPTPALPSIEYQGVRFSYDPTLASNVSVETVPASSGGDDSPYWEHYPEHIQFTFNGYWLSNTFHQPRILVYPVQELEEKSEGGAISIRELRQVLSTRPQAPESLPMMPIFNAAQLLRVQVAYISFGNGQGVRYLTEYAQYAAPINNKDLFYSFQGITEDGRYYVAAVLPISHPNLPADADTFMQGKDWGQFSDVYQPYLEEMVQELNGFSAQSFQPSLSMLDAVVASLQVTRP